MIDLVMISVELPKCVDIVALALSNAVLSSRAALTLFLTCANPLQRVVRTSSLDRGEYRSMEAPFGALLAFSSGRHGLACLA